MVRTSDAGVSDDAVSDNDNGVRPLNIIGRGSGVLLRPTPEGIKGGMMRL